MLVWSRRSEELRSCSLRLAARTLTVLVWSRRSRAPLLFAAPSGADAHVLVWSRRSEELRSCSLRLAARTLTVLVWSPHRCLAAGGGDQALAGGR